MMAIHPFAQGPNVAVVVGIAEEVVDVDVGVGVGVGAGVELA